MIQTLDFAALDRIQAYCRCELLDMLMPKLTLLGEYGALWIVLALILLLRKRTRQSGLALSAGLLGSLLIGNLLLKPLIARPRPCWINESAELLVAAPQDYSFPSGHTLSCFIAATVLLHYDRRLGIPALAIACVVAFSRLYLYVHFPSDVLAGAALGVVIGCFAAWLTDRVYGRRLTREEEAPIIL